MLHLSHSASYDQRLGLNLSTPRNPRMTALVTKYFTSLSREEVPGWRQLTDSTSSDLAVQTSRPYTIRSRGQWTSQPHYPHTKVRAPVTVSHPHQPKTKLDWTPLVPSVRELALEQQGVSEEWLLHLPPLRRLDNSDSHHDHPALTQRPLVVVAEKDVFPVKTAPPKKSGRRGRLRAFNMPVEGKPVQFPAERRIDSISPLSEDAPVQEKIVVTRLVKPVRIPERFKRPGRIIQFSNGAEAQLIGLPSERSEIPLSVSSHSDENSLFVYTEEYGSPSMEPDESERFPGLEDQTTPFPDLQPSPTEQDESYLPTHVPQVSCISEANYTPIAPENTPLLDDVPHYSMDPLAPLFDTTDEETRDKGPKWTSISTLENTLGQDDRPNLETEVTHHREDTLGTEGSLEYFDSDLPNTQILDSFTPPPRSDTPPKDIQEKLSSKVTILLIEPTSPAEVPETANIPTPDSSPGSLGLPSSPRDVKTDSKPPSGLTQEQITELESRMNKSNPGGKKRKISIQPQLMVDGEGRSPRPPRKSVKENKFTRRQSFSSTTPKKPKTLAKTRSQLDVFDFKQDTSQAADLDLVTVPAPADIEAETCPVIQEQAGEESDEDVCAVADLPAEEVKHMQLEPQTRRWSTFADRRERRKSTQSTEEAASSSVSSIKEEGETLATRSANRIAGKSRTLQLKSNPGSSRKLINKKSVPTVPSLEVQTGRGNTMTSSEESPLTAWKQSSVSAVVAKHSAHSSLSSNESGSLEQDSGSDDASAQKRTGENKRTKSKAPRSKAKVKVTEPRLSRKRTSIVSSDYSDHGGDQDSPMIPRNPADEVFVRHFAVNMIAFMNSYATKRSSAVVRGLAQLNKVKKSVLALNYGPVFGQSSRRASLLVRGRTSTLGVPRRYRLRKSITALALSDLKENLDRELHLDEDSDSDGSESPTSNRIAKFSRAEFEIKHLSMLKTLALNLLRMGQEEDEEEVPEQPQLTPAQIWELQYREHHGQVSQTLEALFKDFKPPPITAFTSVVTNFFKDPHSLRTTTDDTSELDRVEMDSENYRETLERRKFLEYSRQINAYDNWRKKLPDEVRQMTEERLNPKELAMFYRDLCVKQRKRRTRMEERNGLVPVVLYAKPRTTDTGLPLEYYQTMVRKARALGVPKDVILSGGAHLVQSEEEYKERLYCRLKHENNLQKFSHKHGT